jgi:hypothetical protein
MKICKLKQILPKGSPLTKLCPIYFILFPFWFAKNGRLSKHHCSDLLAKKKLQK